MLIYIYIAEAVVSYFDTPFLVLDKYWCMFNSLAFVNLLPRRGHYGDQSLFITSKVHLISLIHSSFTVHVKVHLLVPLAPNEKEESDSRNQSLYFGFFKNLSLRIRDIVLPGPVPLKWPIFGEGMWAAVSRAPCSTDLICQFVFLSAAYFIITRIFMPHYNLLTATLPINVR